MQSTPHRSTHEAPHHLAIIMDGNRRWARARGLPDSAGHRAGAAALETLLPSLASTPVAVLTLFAFAEANWRRPTGEVAALLEIIRARLARVGAHCRREGIALEIIGRRDRLGAALRVAVEAAEQTTAAGSRRLRIALDYSGRAALLAAARGFPTEGEAPLLTRRLGDPPDVDLLIRTGGEQRLSDFLLWECANAEFCFLDRLWPEFTGADLERAFAAFAARSRRFGR